MDIIQLHCEKAVHFRIKTKSRSNDKQNNCQKNLKSTIIDFDTTQKSKSNSKNGSQSTISILKSQHRLTLKRKVESNKEANKTKHQKLLIQNQINNKENTKEKLQNQSRSGNYKGSEQKQSLKQGNGSKILKLLLHERQKSISHGLMKEDNIIESKIQYNITQDRFNNSQGLNLFQKEQKLCHKFLLLQNPLSNSTTFLKNQPRAKSLQQENQLSFRNEQQARLNIHQQFTIGIQLPPKKATSIQISTQTISDSRQQQHSFQQYLKYKMLKTQYEQIIHSKKEKIQRMISENAQCQKNYQRLIHIKDEGPVNDRERRVFDLSLDLELAYNSVKEGFAAIDITNSKFYQDLIKQEELTKAKKENSNASIRHLVKCLIVQFEQNKHDYSTQRTTRMLIRILNQLYFVKRIEEQNSGYTQRKVAYIDQQISSLQKSYSHWSSLLFQQRVLLCNFIAQIQSIPVSMTELFGYSHGPLSLQDHQPLRHSSLNNESLYQAMPDHYDQLRQKRCEECFYTKKKVEYIKQTNERIMPIFKALEWLVRDNTKKKSCFQII